VCESLSVARKGSAEEPALLTLASDWVTAPEGSWTAHVPRWSSEALRDASAAFLGYPLTPRAREVDPHGVNDGR
jgi:hypothetical protein